MSFWILTACLALATAGFIARAVMRRSAPEPREAASDLAVYRDQLAEVERDVARGLLNADEAERTRTEIKRRVLEADRRGPSAQISTGAPAMALAALALITASAFLIYGWLGAPGYGDLPLKTRIAASESLRASRPAQAEIEATIPPAPRPADPDYQALVAKLRETVAERPDDLEGLALLARHEANLGNYPAAHAAKSQEITLKGVSATDADFAELADMLIRAAGGYVSPEAELALSDALARAPRNGLALFYSGLLYAQIGRPDRAFPIWRSLLATGPPDAPWLPVIQADIGALAELAGVRYTPPEPRGPSAADIAAANDMAPEDRQAMIRGMVEGLAERLATEGGPSEDWARLINAYRVLGETETADAILAEGRTVFAQSPEDLAVIEAAQ